VTQGLVALPTLGSAPCPVCGGVVLELHQAAVQSVDRPPAARGVYPFTCPTCSRTSYHPEDARQGYCGACHGFTGQLVLDMALRLVPCGHLVRCCTLNGVGQVVSWLPEPGV
jgi:hypothetical protein